MKHLLPYALALVAPALTAAAAPAEPRTPTARWVVDYDDAQCVASRNYGTEDKPLFLGLKPSPRGNVMRIMLIRKGAESETEQRPASVRFDSNRAIGANALLFGDRQTRNRVVSINLPMTQFAANRTASSIEIDAGPFDERLAVPGLSGVMAAFSDCLANLSDVWNVGERYASRIKQSARARQPLRNLFRSTTYPRQAIAEGNTGSVGIVLMIDEAGKVRDCMVEETSGFATLDTVSCHQISAGARFDPALGPDGKPVKSASFHRISWKIAP